MLSSLCSRQNPGQQFTCFSTAMCACPSALQVLRAFEWETGNPMGRQVRFHPLFHMPVDGRSSLQLSRPASLLCRVHAPSA